MPYINIGWINIWIPKFLKTWCEEHPNGLITIQWFTIFCTPFFVLYASTYWQTMVNNNFLSLHTVFTVILFLSPGFTHALRISIEDKSLSSEAIKEIFFLLESMVAYKPTDGWQGWDEGEWSRKFKSLSKALESLITLIIAKRFGIEKNKVEREFDVACNLMVLANKNFEEDKLKELLSNFEKSSGNYDLYKGIDTDKETAAYLLLVGLGEKAIKRGHKTSFIRVYKDQFASLPGAPLLFHWALKKEKSDKLISNAQRISDIESFKDCDFGSNVSDEAKDRFKEIFENNSSIRSFWSIPLYWGKEKQLIGVLNIESKREKFLIDNEVKDRLVFTIGSILPIIEAFAYVFDANFLSISNTQTTATK